MPDEQTAPEVPAPDRPCPLLEVAPGMAIDPAKITSVLAFPASSDLEIPDRVAVVTDKDRIVFPCETRDEAIARASEIIAAANRARTRSEGA